MCLKQEALIRAVCVYKRCRRMGCSKELAELEHVTVKEAINPANQFVKFLPFRYAKEEVFRNQSKSAMQWQDT